MNNDELYEKIKSQKDTLSALIDNVNNKEKNKKKVDDLKIAQCIDLLKK